MILRNLFFRSIYFVFCLVLLINASACIENDHSTLKSLSVTHPTSGVDGFIDYVKASATGGVKIHGWACDIDVDRSIDVHLYAQGKGDPLYIKNTRADLLLDPDVSARCLTEGVQHRFTLVLSADELRPIQNLKVVIFGISTQEKKTNNPLEKSSMLTFPAAAIAQAKRSADPVIARRVQTIKRITMTANREPVWDSTNQVEPANIPDAPALAFRDNTGKSSLVISHYHASRMVGSSLDTLKTQKNYIFNSPGDITENRYNHHHWMFAPYTDDGVHFTALAHHEWYFCLVSDRYQCKGHPAGREGSASYQQRGWVNSITLLKSDNGGANWYVPENHVVATPETWNPTIELDTSDGHLNNYGFFHPSRFVTDEQFVYSIAGYEYNHDLVPVGSHVVGLVILRATKKLSNLQIYDTRTRSYQKIPDDGDQITVIPGSERVTLGTVTHNTVINKYILFSVVGNGAITYRTTASLAQPIWSSPQEIAGSRTFNVNSLQSPGFMPNNYISLIDPQSPGYIYEKSAAAPYIYYSTIGTKVRFDMRRDLYRTQLNIEFE